MSNCPKCGKKIKVTYLKAECPQCGVNMLYYKMDEQLAADAERAKKETDAVNKFLGILKDSSVKTPLHIIRLVLFFTPLASMCLPMFWAGHKNVSLIAFIMSIINHGLDFGAMAADKSYLFAVLSIIFVIVLSLAVIICSLFSSTKRGFRRNIIFSTVNTAVFGLMGVLTIANGGYAKAGYYVTLLIYALELALQYATARPKNKKRLICTCISVVLCACFAFGALPFGATQSTICFGGEKNEGDISVVSFNVASAFGTVFEDTDSMERCARFSNYMNECSPDLIGTQEMNSYWLDELGTTMPDYASYGVKRGGDSEEKNSEMNAVLWKKSRFSSLEQNTIWLSETPNEESKYTYIDDEGKPAEAGCNRICTYVVLIDNQTDEKLIFLNTHLDNASQQAANFGISVILDRIDALKTRYGEDVSIILTGDFNETDGGEAYKLAAEKLNDCTDKAQQTATYQEWGYRQTGDKPIDFIFTTGEGYDYSVLNYLDNGYISDHYGIYSNIKL